MRPEVETFTNEPLKQIKLIVRSFFYFDWYNQNNNNNCLTLSKSETCVIGIVDCIIPKSFHMPMRPSTWILTSDIFRDFFTFANICDFPREKCGIVRVAPHVANSSSLVNALSARTASPCCNFSKNLLLIVSSLSDTLPLQPCERKLIAPAGVIPIKHLMVWWCL